MHLERRSKESVTIVERWVTWEKIVEVKTSRRATTIEMVVITIAMEDSKEVHGNMQWMWQSRTQGGRVLHDEEEIQLQER